jgi:hypothetical protein
LRIKGRAKSMEIFWVLRSPLPSENLPYAITMDQVGMSDPSALSSKLKKKKSRKKCPDKQITAQDLSPSIRLHGIRIITRLHGIKLQGIRFLIKPHGIMPQGARLLSISGLSRFVHVNHSGKSKHFKKPQKVEDDLYCREPPIWMQSMMLWMDQQMKSYQQPPIGRQAWVKKKEDIHPMRRNGLT